MCGAPDQDARPLSSWARSIAGSIQGDFGGVVPKVQKHVEMIIQWNESGEFCSDVRLWPSIEPRAVGCLITG